MKFCPLFVGVCGSKAEMKRKQSGNEAKRKRKQSENEAVSKKDKRLKTQKTHEVFY